MVSTHRDGRHTRITLSPNCSADWRQSKRFLWLLALPVSLIALGSWLAGATLVAPFAGLEFGLLALCMRHVCRQSCRRQVITLSSGHVRLESGIRGPEQQWLLRRPAAHLRVQHPSHPLALPTLRLVDEQVSVSVGGFLNREDRALLRRCLRDAGLMEVSNRWWLGEEAAGHTGGHY